MAQNITQHNDSELSDLFLHDEALFGIACTATSSNELVELANNAFVFNEEQRAELVADFENGVFS